MSTNPSWITPAGFLFTATEAVFTSTVLVASGTNVAYSVISGSLPSGLGISSTGTISGTPLPIVNQTTNKFVVRATSDGVSTDRTFSIDVTGRTPLTWTTANTTNTGSNVYLNVGPQGEAYAINRQYVKFPISAESQPGLSPGDYRIEYYARDTASSLPPGLRISTDGVINGFIDDVITDPKTYTFEVVATDGTVTTSTTYSILVITPDIVRNPVFAFDLVELGLIATNTNYVPPLQFVNPSDLGIVRAQNIISLDVSAYDPYPEEGINTYAVVTSTSVSNVLPNYFVLDPVSGLYQGTVPYQSAYTQRAEFSISATKFISTTSQSVAVNTFTLAIQGEVEDAIEWVSTNSIGTLSLGATSDLKVEARTLTGDYRVNYRQIGGQLPPGLELKIDGSLSGKVSGAENTGTFVFEVQASDIYRLSEITKEFSLSVVKESDKEYTEVYCRPFFHPDVRKLYQSFITDSSIFDPNLIYRYFDPNFGVQNNIKMVLKFAIERPTLAQAVEAVKENFYRRRLYFGDIKTAVARDDSGQDQYEVIYAEIVDHLSDVSQVIYENDEIYYPASIENMRTKFRQIRLADGSVIDVNDQFLPKFMRTAQPGEYRTSGYISLVPICYVKPGNAKTVLARIRNSGFDFKSLDFEIDRVIIQETQEESSAKYLIFERQALGDLLPSDNLVSYPGEFELPPYNGQPITRK